MSSALVVSVKKQFTDLFDIPTNVYTDKALLVKFVYTFLK